MTDSLDRRDWFVDQAARAYQDAGVPVPHEALQKRAAADLAFVDQAKAAGALRPAKAKADDRPRREEQQAPVVAAKLGQRFQRRDIDEVEQIVKMPPLRGVEAEKTLAMAARIQKLGERDPSARVKQGESWEHAYVYPRFVRAIFAHTIHMQQGLGSYQGLSWEDRKSKHERAMQDICDASTGVLGPWWVK